MATQTQDQEVLDRWEEIKNIPEVEVTDELRKEVLDKIIVARVGLLMRHPFFGNMATRLKVQEASDWCPTAATDGRHLFYSVPFFAKMTNKEVEFVIAHEILHCVYDHMSRREKRDPQVHNIAADYIVNNILVRDKIGEKPKDIPIFQDFKYDGWSSEDVYDDIYSKYDEEELKQLGQLLDEHIDWDKESDGNGAGSKDNKEKSPSDKPSYSKDELRKIRDEIKESMMSSAQSTGAGNLPKEIQRMIKELTEPKMNWRELLQQQIQSTIKNDFTFSRPSRKGWHTGAILPGLNFQDTIDLCIAIDMSGSISNEQAQVFLSEIKGIMEQYQDYKIKIWCFDTEVYNEQDFDAANDDLLSYEVQGGGGTDFDANWRYMKDNDIVPKKFIMFTDGYTWDSWGDADYCDTIFVIHSHHNKDIEAPFGITTHYENETKSA
jgi:predicted metal-dependent peptidase